MYLKVYNTINGNFYLWEDHKDNCFPMSKVDMLTVSNNKLCVVLKNGFTQVFDLDIYGFSVFP
jgi:hypothetical protein